MASVKQQALTLYDLAEETAERAVRLYELYQSEYGLMPGAARKAAVGEAMEVMEERIGARLDGRREVQDDE